MKRNMIYLCLCLTILAVIYGGSVRGRLTTCARQTAETNQWPVVKKDGDKRKNALAAYKKLLSGSTVKLNKHTESATADAIFFRPCDINRDGVPELLIEYDNASTADGFYHILGVVNGKINSIMRSYMSSFSIYNNSIIEEKGGGRSVNGCAEWTKYYKFNGKKSILLAEKYIENDEVTNPEEVIVRKQYKIGKKKVKKSKYSAYIKKIKKKKVIDCSQKKQLYKNTKRNRKKYL